MFGPNQQLKYQPSRKRPNILPRHKIVIRAHLPRRTMSVIPRFHPSSRRVRTIRKPFHHPQQIIVPVQITPPPLRSIPPPTLYIPPPPSQIILQPLDIVLPSSSTITLPTFENPNNIFPILPPPPVKYINEISKSSDEPPPPVPPNIHALPPLPPPPVPPNIPALTSLPPPPPPPPPVPQNIPALPPPPLPHVVPQNILTKITKQTTILDAFQRHTNVAMTLQNHTRNWNLHTSGIYMGDNVHAYTNQVRETIKSYIPQLTSQYGTIVTEVEFDNLLQEFENKYGIKPIYTNLKSVYRNEGIFDPEIPGINVAIVLKAVWEKMKQLNDDSAFRHFGETLDQANTCLAGITGRICIDYIAFCTD